MNVTVYPFSVNSVNLAHPQTGQKPKPEGTEWPYDGFTCRMIADGEVTDTPPAAPAQTPTPTPAPADKPAK